MPTVLQESGITTAIADFKVKFRPGVPVAVGQVIQMLNSDGTEQARYEVIGINTGETDRLQIVCDVKLVV